MLVLTAWNGVIGTLIVPILAGSRLTRLVDKLVIVAYHLLTRRAAEVADPGGTL